MSWNEKSLNQARAAGRGHRRRTRGLPILLPALLSSASIAALVLIPQQAEAQSSTWGGVTNSYVGAGNWTNSNPPLASGQFAFFDTLGVTGISVSAPVNPGGWSFTANSQAYVITGSAVTFGNNFGLANHASANISIANSLGGAGGLTQAGTGTLTLTGANTYTNGNLIAAGKLQLSGAGTLGATTNNLTMDGGTLDLGGTNQTLSGVTLNGGTIQTGTLTSSGEFSLASGTTGGTISAILAGAADVSVGGTGTTILAGANTYTGNTYINAGTLQITGSGTLGAASNELVMNGGTLDLGGTSLTVNGGLGLNAGTIQNGTLSSSGAFGLGSGTISAVLAGTGGVSQNGSGTTTLSAANTYTGPTVVNAGTLQISGSGTLGNTGNSLLVLGGTLDLGGTTQTANKGVEIDGATVRNGTLSSSGGFNSYVAANTTGTVSAALAGSGGLSIQASSPSSPKVGTLVLTGNNSYTGGTTISAGTLQVGNGGTSGALGAGAITDNGALAFNRSDTVTVASTISGTGALTQAGTGTLILNGTNSFTGTATVAGGILEIGDASNAGASIAGPVNVQSGGTLSGHGTVKGAVTVASGASLQPGGTIGTLTVNGNLSLPAGSTFVAELSPTAADRVNVGGAVTLGGNLQLIADPGTYSAGTDFKLISAASVTGAFTSVTGQVAGFTNTVQYSATGVDLILSTPSSGSTTTATVSNYMFGGYGTTPNQIAAANALTAASSSGALYTAMGALVGSSVASVPATLGQLAGDIRPSLRAAAIEDSRSVRDALLDHMDHAGGTTLWGTAFAGYGRLASDGNAANLHHDSAGFLAGADMSLSSAVTLGVDGGYTSNSARTPGSLSTASGDSGHVGAYAAWSLSNIHLDIGGDYGFGSVTIDRAVPQLGVGASGNQDQQTGQVFADLGYRFALGGAVLEPHAGLAHITATGGAFAETGSTAALSGGEKSDSVTYSMLGLRAGMADLALASDLTLSPRLDLGWQHALSVLTPYQTVSYVNAGTSFLVLGTPLAEDAAALQAGVDLKAGHSATLSLFYDRSFSSRVENHAFRGTLNWRF
jgi:outer membrane autotransporter protein